MRATTGKPAEKREGRGQSRRMRLPFLKQPLACVIDLLTLSAAFALSYLLRFDFEVPAEHVSQGIRQLPFVMLVQFVMLMLAGVYTFVWRYVGIPEVRSFVRAALSSCLIIIVGRSLLPESLASWRVPLSVAVTDSLLAFGGAFGWRLCWRAVHEWKERRRKAGVPGNGSRKRVLLIGAGSAGILAAEEIRRNCSQEFDVRGFVDDDPKKRLTVIHQIRVIGTTEELPRLVRELGIDLVIISIAHTARENFRRILNVCSSISVKVQVIPALYEILQGVVQITRIRGVQIEDLLGRDPVSLDEEEVERFVTGKVVMITGAGGSIGSELARQVSRFQPARLLLVERAEGALFNIERQVAGQHEEVSSVALLADVGDERRMRSIFQTYTPHVIFHAAAHKHVPLMEFNPVEAIKNNVLATRLLGELAGEFKAEALVMISTDKAVQPTSIMGASKRVAELVVQSLNRRFPTRYVVVRFGNVIGSAGSVIPIFREQISRGGPVTVTHQDMVRYFMTVAEAAQLVLQAGAMGEGGEIFILDMGKPVKILDLAKDLITLSGFKPFEDIDIVFTGVRPGEKLYEEWEITEEGMSKTRHPKLYIGKIAAYPEEKLREALTCLTALAQGGNERELRRYLGGLLPEAQLAPAAAEAPASGAPNPSPEGDAKWGDSLDSKLLPA